MKKEIKELRVRIDGLAQLVKELKPIKLPKCIDAKTTIVNEQRPSINSKEIEKCYDSLILAKAWLGKVLGELGSESPYPKDGTRKTIADIEPTADTEMKGISKIAGNKDWAFINGTHIERVDWLREEIKETIREHLNISEMLENFYDTKFRELEQTEVEVMKNGGDYDLSLEASKLPNPEFELRECYKHLVEARFWLGFELQRIREEDKYKSVDTDKGLEK